MLEGTQVKHTLEIHGECMLISQWYKRPELERGWAAQGTITGSRKAESEKYQAP